MLNITTPHGNILSVLITILSGMEYKMIEVFNDEKRKAQTKK